MFFRKRSSFTDNDLDSVLVACRAGDAKAQRTLFRQYYSYAKSICLRYTSSGEEAEDVLNEGFLKVFQRLDQYNPSHPFKAWLRAIMINTAISYYRKYHKLDTESQEGKPEQEAAFDDDVLDHLAAEEILAMVQKLPPAQRTVFSMHVVDGYSLREIADLLQFNEVTVRSHFLRSRINLQQMIKKVYPHLFSSNSSTSIRFYEN